MVKRFVFTIALIATIGGMVGITQTAQVDAKKKKENNHVPVTICHATNSYKNPYVVNNVDDSSIDEENNKYLNRHGDHTGPVFYPTIPKHTKWGDIIPPFTNSAGSSFPGYNWTAEGKAIYDNGCKLVEPYAVLDFSVKCIERKGTNFVRVRLINLGTAPGTATVNGAAIIVAAGDRETRRFANNTQITITINGQAVYSQVVDCDKPEEPQPVADLSFSYVCDVRAQQFELTLVNRGDAAGDVTLNGDQVTVPANDSRDLSLPAGRDGAKVTLVIDGKTELNQTFYCIAGRGAGGMGGSTPTTPVTVIPGKGAAGDVVSLPVTSGASDQLAALVVMSMGALTAIGGYVLRSRSGELSL